MIATIAKRYIEMLVHTHCSGSGVDDTNLGNLWTGKTGDIVSLRSARC